MRVLFTVLFIGLSLTVLNAQRSPITPKIRKFKNDTIIWKQDSLLKAEDFKGKVKNNGPLGLSAVGIFLYPVESGGELKFRVEALFVKSKSYIVKTSDYVLKHEQIHFDICELFARKMRQRIAEKDFTKVKKVKEELDKIYIKTFKEYLKEQDKYDGDTEHGLNSIKQKLWDADIAARLKELEAYASPEVVLD